MSNDQSRFEITPKFASQFVRDVEATMPASGPSGMPTLPEGATVQRWASIPVWTVTDPYTRTDHTFEQPANVLLYALENARSDRPTIIRRPGGGQQFIVMAEDPRVTLQAVRHLTGPVGIDGNQFVLVDRVDEADAVAAYRKGYADAERELGDRVPIDVIRSLIAQGRREAAEAIREQARMFGVQSKTEGEPGTMLSFIVAAQLAEGTTGVQDGTS